MDFDCNSNEGNYAALHLSFDTDEEQFPTESQPGGESTQETAQEPLQDPAKEDDNSWIFDGFAELSGFNQSEQNTLLNDAAGCSKEDLNSYLPAETCQQHSPTETSRTDDDVSSYISVNSSFTLPVSGIAIDTDEVGKSQRKRKRPIVSPIENNNKKKINLASWITHDWLPYVSKTSKLLEDCVNKIEHLTNVVEQLQKTQNTKFNVIQRDRNTKHFHKLEQIEEFMSHFYHTHQNNFKKQFQDFNNFKKQQEQANPQLLSWRRQQQN